jgi:hypothetical protein
MILVEHQEVDVRRANQGNFEEGEEVRGSSGGTCRSGEWKDYHLKAIWLDGKGTFLSGVSDWSVSRSRRLDGVAQ